MDIQGNDINRIKDLLGYIKQLSDDGLSNETVQGVVNLLENIKPYFRHLILNDSFPEITRLTINRKVIEENKRIDQIKYLKYPPSDSVNNYGRCNRPKQSVLYAGFIKPVIISELKPEVGDLVTTSIWKVRDNQTMFYCPIFLNQPMDGTLNIRSFEINQSFENTIKSLPENEKILIRFISQFVADEFSKTIKTNNNFEYFLSAYFSNMIFNELNCGKVEAICYPSVPEKLSFENLAIKPDIFEQKYELAEVSDSVVAYKRSGKFHYRLEGIGSTNNFDLDNGKIIWEQNMTERISQLMMEFKFEI
jgi:hypothetical protein